MGRRPLKGYAPRMLGVHDGLAGRAYRRAWDALDERFDLAHASRLIRLEAGRVAAAWVQLELSTRALAEARRRREREKGRRPGSRDIERLARRQGLADGSYQLALSRLESMVGTPKPVSLADLARKAMP